MRAQNNPEQKIETLNDALERVAKEALDKASELIAGNGGAGALEEAAALITAAAHARRAEVASTSSLGG